MLDIWLLNVGHGDSIVLRNETRDGLAFGIVDSNRIANEEPAVLRKLKQLAAERLSFVLLTHPHADHYRGMLRVLEHYKGRIDCFYSFPLGEFIRSKRDKLSATFQRVISGTEGSLRETMLELFGILNFALQEQRAERLKWEEAVGRWNRIYPTGFHRPRLEVLLPLPKCKGRFFELLGDTNPDALRGEAPNVLSVVLRIVAGETAIVLGADSTHVTWYDHRHQTFQSGDKPGATVMKIPHHGSRHDVQSDMLNYWYGDAHQVGQRFALISADGRRHPHVEALNALRQTGIHPYCTNLARPCGGGRVDQIFTSADVSQEVTRIINSGDIELRSELIQPCQGEVHVTMDDTGKVAVTPEFPHPCGFRGDFSQLGLAH